MDNQEREYQQIVKSSTGNKDSQQELDQFQHPADNISKEHFIRRQGGKRREDNSGSKEDQDVNMEIFN